MHATSVLLSLLALLAGPVAADSPERPPDELIELLRDVDLLDDYGDLLDVETDDASAPEAAPAGPAKPPATSGVQEGQDGRP